MGRRKKKQNDTAATATPLTPLAGNEAARGEHGLPVLTAVVDNSGRRVMLLPHPTKTVQAGNNVLKMAPKGEADSRIRLVGSGEKLPSQKTSGQEDKNNSNTNANSSKSGARVVRGKVTGDLQKSGSGEEEPNFKGTFTKLEKKALLRALAGQRIFELRKKNLSFPNAKYFCRLCEYHLDKASDCERHVNESRHRRKKEASDSQGILEHIPDPSPGQAKGLDVVVRSVAERVGLPLDELQKRQEVVGRLQGFLKNFREDLVLEMYGSSLSTFGLKESDINVDIHGKGPSPHNLMQVCNFLQESGAPAFVKVQSDYNAKVPVVRLVDAETGLALVLGINGLSAVQTSRLLQLYSLADPRVRDLVVTMRNWAKICHLDRQEEGTLPPFAYSIMVVFFLQHISPPVLPVFNFVKQGGSRTSSSEKQEAAVDFETAREEALRWKSQNKSCVGLLWLQLLKFYCISFDNTSYIICIRQSELLTRKEKKWQSRKLAIEDPFSPKKNIASSMTNTVIFEYFESCLRKAFGYFAMPRDKDGNVTISQEALKELANRKTDSLLQENQLQSSSATDQLGGVKPTRSSTSPAPDRLRGSSADDLDDDDDDDEVDEEDEVDDEGESTRNEESSSEGSIGEPVAVQPNRSISEKLKAAQRRGSPVKTLSPSSKADAQKFSKTDVNSRRPFSKQSVADSTDSAFSSLASSCSTPISGANMSGSSIAESSTFITDISCNTSGLEASGYNTSAFNVSALDSSADSTPREAAMDDGSRVTNIARSSTDSSISEKMTRLHMDEAEEAVEGMTDEFEHLCVHEGYVQEQSSVFRENGDLPLPYPDDDYSDAYGYLFTEDILTGGKGPAVICGYCEKEGHTKAGCPEDQLPAVRPLRAMTAEHRDLLDYVIGQVINDFSPSDVQLMQRNKVVKDLETFVRQIYPDACFSLFGSSCNGFGFYSSDLDICMTFRNKTVEDIDVVEVIEAVCKKLLQRRSLSNVFAITTAKVPIVKFFDRETKLEGDISLYNILAQRNTRLLYAYSQIDKRVQQLGFAVKILAKVCSIGDASRGSLSSYGYILMLLHYLQQCKPPVIPVLQEMRPVGEWPEVIVEGCNTWFFTDLHLLPKVWEGFQRNKQSVGELWVGFLCYYLEVFDWKGMVVSIRQRAKLSKFEKMWTGKTIAVEDPFDLNHNLGGGLSRKMNNFIYSTFVKCRMHFGNPISNLQRVQQQYNTAADYFFSTELLTDGKPPNDRGCRLCGKIGHIVRDCPNRSGSRRRQGENNDREQNQGATDKVREKDKKEGKKVKAKVKEGQEQAAGKEEAAGEKTKGGSIVRSERKVENSSTTAVTAVAKTSDTDLTTMVATKSNSVTETAPTNTAPVIVDTSTSVKVPAVSTTLAVTQPQTLLTFPVRASTPLTSTPVRTVSGSMRPPGIPMDVQQLFSLFQQAGGRPLGLPINQHTRASMIGGASHSSRQPLSPEQQVAILRLSPGLKQESPAVPSPRSVQLSPEKPVGTVSDERRMTPLPLESLFQGPSTLSQSAGESSNVKNSTTTSSKKTPLPLKSLIAAKNGGASSPGKTAGTESTNSPNSERTPPPLKSLFPPSIPQSINQHVTQHSQGGESQNLPMQSPPSSLLPLWLPSLTPANASSHSPWQQQQQLEFITMLMNQGQGRRGSVSGQPQPPGHSSSSSSSCPSPAPFQHSSSPSSTSQPPHPPFTVPVHQAIVGMSSIVHPMAAVPHIAHFFTQTQQTASGHIQSLTSPEGLAHPPHTLVMAAQPSQPVMSAHQWVMHQQQSPAMVAQSPHMHLQMMMSSLSAGPLLSPGTFSQQNHLAADYESGLPSHPGQPPGLQPSQNKQSDPTVIPQSQPHAGLSLGSLGQVIPQVSGSYPQQAPSPSLLVGSPPGNHLPHFGSPPGAHFLVGSPPSQPQFGALPGTHFLFGTPPSHQHQFGTPPGPQLLFGSPPGLQAPFGPQFQVPHPQMYGGPSGADHSKPLAFFPQPHQQQSADMMVHIGLQQLGLQSVPVVANTAVVGRAHSDSPARGDSSSSIVSSPEKSS